MYPCADCPFASGETFDPDAEAALAIFVQAVRGEKYEQHQRWWLDWGCVQVALSVRDIEDPEWVVELLAEMLRAVQG